MKKHFYEILVLLLAVILPLVSALIESNSDLYGGDLEIFLFSLGKWTVFWALGVRLLMAGISQIVNPTFTAKSILGIKDPEAGQVVRELGFANLSIGIAGVLTVILPPIFIFWTMAVAFIGGLFLALDGIEHLRKKQRNLKENLALATDFYVGAIALAFSITLIIVQTSIPTFG